MRKRIVLIKDLVGTAPIQVDQRTRNADGSLKYPEQQREPRPIKLLRVWIDKNRERDGIDWLMWEWEHGLKQTPYCNYSGIVMTSKHAHDYALEVL